jgi:hypothetical protein
MKDIIRNVAIASVVVLIAIFSYSYMTTPYPGIQKNVDSMTCEI